jgi:hypothetical protein
MNASVAILALFLLADDATISTKSTADPDPKSLLIPADVQANTQRLVVQLGNKSFPARKEALTELQGLGRLALPAIEKGLSTSSVPEVALWCEQLLPQAQSLDLKARVECFLADTEGKFKHDLPAATEFFRITGQSDQARTLFKDLWLSNSRDLFLALSISPEEAAKAVTTRRTDLTNRTISRIRDAEAKAAPTSLEVLAVLFVESMIPERLLTAQNANVAVGRGIGNPCSILTQSALRADLDVDGKKKVYAAIISNWYETREETRTMYYCLTSSASMKVPVPLKLARKLLDRKDATPMYKALAVCQLGRGGRKEDIEALVPMLKDDSLVTAGIVAVGGNGNQIRSPIQLQDVALAMTLVLNGDKPTEYGYNERYPNQTMSTTLRFNYMNFYFDDAEGKAKDLRAAALKKWDEKQAADKTPTKK